MGELRTKTFKGKIASLPRKEYPDRCREDQSACASYGKSSSSKRIDCEEDCMRWWPQTLSITGIMTTLLKEINMSRIR